MSTIEQQLAEMLRQNAAEIDLLKKEIAETERAMWRGYAFAALAGAGLGALLAAPVAKRVVGELRPTVMVLRGVGVPTTGGSHG